MTKFQETGEAGQDEAEVSQTVAGLLVAAVGDGGRLEGVSLRALGPGIHHLLLLGSISKAILLVTEVTHL